MLPNYWLKQSPDQPLFTELLWSRPENKQFAGKLAVMGGNLHGFAAPAEAYQESLLAGVGLTRVLLPDALKSLVRQLFETVEYAPSTPSGSFSQKALAEWLSLAAWADAVLLAGDFGRNSETAIIIEKFIQKYQGNVILTKDAADYAINLPKILLPREQTTLVVSMAQLRKLSIQAGLTQAITVGVDLIRLVEALHELTERCPISFVVKHNDVVCIASGGKVSTTKLKQDIPIWRVKTAAHAAVWSLQNPSKTFEALTTSVLNNI